MVVRFGTVIVHVTNTVVTLGPGSLPTSLRNTGGLGERGATGGWGTPPTRVTVTLAVSVLVRVAASDAVMVEVPTANVSGTGKGVPVVTSTVTMTVAVDTDQEVVTALLAGTLL